MLFLTVKDLAILSYRNYSWLLANLGAPVSHTVLATPVCDNAALCWQCCLCGSGVRADLQIKGSMGKKMGRMPSACLFQVGPVLQPVSVFVHSTWAHLAAGRDGKCQSSNRKSQGIVVVRQSFCLRMLMEVLGTSWMMRLPSLFLIEACTWEIHLLALWFLLTTWCFVDNYTSGTTKISALQYLPNHNTWLCYFCKNLNGGWILIQVNLHNKWLHFRAQYYQTFLSYPEAVQKNFPGSGKENLQQISVQQSVPSHSSSTAMTVW